MRVIRNVIYHDHSNGPLATRALHARLDDAANILYNSFGGHNGPPLTSYEEDRTAIEEAIRDIAAGLLGCDVVFTNTGGPQVDDTPVIRAYMEAREKKRYGRGDEQCLRCHCPALMVRAHRCGPCVICHGRKSAWHMLDLGHYPHVSVGPGECPADCWYCQRES